MRYALAALSIEETITELHGSRGHRSSWSVTLPPLEGLQRPMSGVLRRAERRSTHLGPRTRERSREGDTCKPAALPGTHLKRLDTGIPGVVCSASLDE